jgi:hypothetical protein
MGILCPDGVIPERRVLPGEIERFRWAGRQEMAIAAWYSPSRLPRWRILRLLLHDLQLQTEYTVLLDDATVVSPRWWDELQTLLKDGIDYAGQPCWHHYSSRQLDTILTQPWYMGVPFDRRESGLGVSFMNEGIIVVRSQRVRDANFPSVEIPDQTNGLVMLGEVARQMQWRQKTFGCLGENSETVDAKKEQVDTSSVSS